MFNCWSGSSSASRIGAKALVSQCIRFAAHQCDKSLNLMCMLMFSKKIVSIQENSIAIGLKCEHIKHDE